MLHQGTTSAGACALRGRVWSVACLVTVCLGLGAARVSAVPVLGYSTLAIDDGTSPPSVGDRDGYPERGESVLIWVTLVNSGTPTARVVFGDFELLSGTSVTLQNTHLTWPDIPPGGTRRSDTGLLMVIAPNCPLGTNVFIRGTVDESDPTTGPWQFDVGPFVVVSVSTVRGTVLDQNTSQPIPGAEVTVGGGMVKKTLTLADGSYEIRGLGDGTYRVTIQRASFGASVPTSRTIVVPPDAPGTDFLLTSPLRDVRPTSLTLVVGRGGTGEAALWINNIGTANLTWWLRERPGTGPTSLNLDVKPMVEALKITDTVSPKAMAAALNKVPLQQPQGYKVSFASPTAYSPKILVYGDDFIHGIPTYMDRALTRLHLSYTAYHVWAYAAFEDSLENGGPWDLVILSNEGGPAPPTSLLDALDQYVLAGGKLAIYCYLMGNTAEHPLWAHLGVSFREIVGTPPLPVYWWEPDHLLFHAPDSVPQFIALTSDMYIYGQRVAPLPGGVAIAGYTQGGPQADQAAMVLGRRGSTIFRGFGDIANNADLNGDGVLDGVQLWENIIDYFVGSVPWMDEQPRWERVAAKTRSNSFMTVETTTMTVGTYRTAVVVTTNELRDSVTTVPVTLSIVPSATSPTAPGRPVPDITPFTSRTTVVYHWTPSTDPDGVQYYRCQVGTRTPGGSELLDANVGTSLTATAVGADGQTLYCRVRAVNSHSQAGPWSLSSIPTTIDVAPPTAPGRPTDPGPYTSRTLVRFTWTAATDPGTSPSGLRSYDLQVGTAPGLSNIFNGNVGNVLTRVVGGGLNGQTLYARVRARDRVGNIGPWSPVSDGILIDTAVPLAPARPTDEGIYTSSTLVRFNWPAASDAGTSGTGIASYDLQVGTRPGLSDVFTSNVGNVLTMSVTGVSGQTLYARLRARDLVGNIGPWSLASNGILIDTDAPTTPSAPTDKGLYTSSTTVTFNWTATADAGTSGSGVSSYDLQVGTWPNASNVFNGHVGGNLSATVTGGASGKKLFARVRAHDRAGNTGPWSRASHGILIDTIAPYQPLGRPTDGGEFTSSPVVRFTWQAATDPGTSASGVASYDLGVGSFWTGPNLYVGNVGNRLWATYTGTHGQTLYVWVRTHDKAGNVSIWGGNSDGITIDLVRPGLKPPKAAARDDWSLYVYFDEPVVNAGKPANYAFDKGLRALDVTTVNSMLYLVHTTRQTPLTSYTLTVSTAVRDRAGNPMDPTGRTAKFLGQFRTSARSWQIYR